MELLRLSFTASNLGPREPLGMEIWLDRNKLYDNTIAPGAHHIVQQIPIEDREYRLKIVLKDKQDKHTVVDENNNIVEDSLLRIKDLCLDEINIDQIMWEKAQYVHDSNGTAVKQVHKFFGDMGCNGHVQLSFSAPIYMWLLENM